MHIFIFECYRKPNDSIDMDNNPKKDANLCNNCDTPLEVPYCSQCGQSETEYNRPFRFVIYGCFYAILINE